MEDIILADGRYPQEAYAFLHDGLTRAVREVHGKQRGGERESMHVSGQQLCEGLRNEALERYGMLARTVLQKWNIHGTIDFGNMVYLLIENGLMKRTDEDSIEDFRDVYDFTKAFDVETRFELRE